MLDCATLVLESFLVDEVDRVDSNLYASCRLRIPLGIYLTDAENPLESMLSEAIFNL